MANLDLLANSVENVYIRKDHRIFKRLHLEIRQIACMKGKNLEGVDLGTSMHLR